ncbi:LysR family transcriptional regulator [Aestuariibius sp. HNIBRBA575]|uniref:LysR family transcriptional regulator n=1 Tax=Aestuariibius sp. HNIBRBA575 TaxID=3233343 RepID=UPI0034A18AD9
MNWQAISFDWNQIRAFLATAEEGSFSAAARALNSTQPTLGRQVAGLEEALGVTLFERGARGPILTQPGHELLDHVRAMGEAANRVSLVASGQSQDVTGEVSITAVDLFAVHLLTPVLHELQRTAPGVSIRIIASNEVQNLSRREADIALRHVRPNQPELYAKLVATLRANFYATPHYLDRVGRARSFRDLERYTIIGGVDMQEFIDMVAAKGVTLHADQFKYACNSGLVTENLARSGLGVTVLPEQIGDQDPEFERAAPDFPPIEFPVWLITHRELHTSKRIRVVFDAIAQELSNPD